MFSDLLTKALGAIMASPNSLSIKSTPYPESGLGVPIQTLSGGKIKIKDTVHEIAPKTHKVLSSTGFDGKNVKYKMVF